MITLDRVDFTKEAWDRLTKEVIRDNKFTGSLNEANNKNVNEILKATYNKNDPKTVYSLHMIESISLYDIGEIVINE